MQTARQRVVLHSIVRDGYEQEHERIPEDLVAAFGRLGVHDWRIWRSGNHMFHLVECDDFDAAMRALADEPADAAWQAQIGPFVETYLNADGEPGFVPLELVWALAEQRDRSA